VGNETTKIGIQRIKVNSPINVRIG